MLVLLFYDCLLLFLQAQDKSFCIYFAAICAITTFPSILVQVSKLDQAQGLYSILDYISSTIFLFSIEWYNLLIECFICNLYMPIEFFGTVCLASLFNLINHLDISFESEYLVGSVVSTSDSVSICFQVEDMLDLESVHMLYLTESLRM